MQRVAVIVNGTAGGGRCGARVQPLVQRLAERYPGLETRWTTGPGDATRLATELAAEADVVVAVGGDGTLHEVVNGLMRAERRPALGLLPLGTGNSFGRDFGLHELEPALEALLRGDGRPVDVVEVRHAEGTVFSLNLVSLGFSAEAGDLTNRRFKRLGATGYVAAVLVSLLRLHHPRFPFACDEGEVDARPVSLLSFCNSRFTGGTMEMAPRAVPDDGRLDVVFIGPMGRARFLSCFPRIFQGTHAEMPEVELSTAARVRFPEGPAVPVMIDGEVLTLSLRELVVRPGALQVLA